MTALDRVFRIGAAGAGRRLGVIAVVYAAHATAALAFAWPLAGLLAHPVMAHPRGDRVLFEPRATHLIETLRLVEGGVSAAAKGMTLGFLATLYLGLFPLGALLFALAREGRARWRDVTIAALRAFGPLSALLGAMLLLAALACAVPLVVGEVVDNKLRPRFGDRDADLLEAGFRLVALALAGIVGVVHDLARAAVVARELSALRAAVLAMATFAAHPIAAIGAWALRGLSGLLLVAVVARATTHIGVDQSLRLLAVTLLHQAVAFGLVFLRADWLAFAIGMLGGRPPSYTTER